MAVDGLDQRVVAQLAAQRGEVHVENLRRPVPVLVPGPLDDLLPADQPPWVGRQALQDRELLGRERHVGAVHGHLAGPQVDGERAVPQHLAGRATGALAAAQHRADPGQQLGQPEWLHQVVVGPLVEGEHPVGLLAPRGNHDDCRLGLLAQPAADVHAIDVGQPEVKQDDIGYRAAQRLGAKRHALRRVPRPVKAPHKLGGNARVVLHHQHMSHATKVIGNGKRSRRPAGRREPRESPQTT